MKRQNQYLTIARARQSRKSQGDELLKFDVYDVEDDDRRKRDCNIYDAFGVTNDMSDVSNDGDIDIELNVSVEHSKNSKARKSLYSNELKFIAKTRRYEV